jgi:hypothetical protein
VPFRVASSRESFGTIALLLFVHGDREGGGAGDTSLRLGAEAGGTLGLALDAVVHVGDTVPLEDPGAL